MKGNRVPGGLILKGPQTTGSEPSLQMKVYPATVFVQVLKGIYLLSISIKYTFYNFLYQFLAFFFFLFKYSRYSKKEKTGASFHLQNALSALTQWSPAVSRQGWPLLHPLPVLTLKALHTLGDNRAQQPREAGPPEGGWQGVDTSTLGTSGLLSL